MKIVYISSCLSINSILCGIYISTVLIITAIVRIIALAKRKDRNFSHNTYQQYINILFR